MSNYFSVEDSDSALLKQWRPPALRSVAHTSVLLIVMPVCSVHSLHWTVLGGVAEGGEGETAGRSPDAAPQNSCALVLWSLSQ
ncbi:hypothetical protein GJAV_G00205390 [Gymnothorax javanicus]|nr:hypothetical protein GJAV_G00205390 [Gymnothorax javanicus]